MQMSYKKKLEKMVAFLAGTSLGEEHGLSHDPKTRGGTLISVYLLLFVV